MTLETAVHRFRVRRLIIVAVLAALAVSIVPVSASARVIQPQVDPPRASTSAAGTSALAVSAGWFHTCAIKGDSTVACWGLNQYGESSPLSGTFKAVDAGV